MHDIHVAVAKHYVENLKEEVKKGMKEKAQQGLYPGRAPFGYRNNPATRCVEIDPARAPIIKRIFDLYGSGEHSLTTLRKALIAETGVKINRAYLENILKNPFYTGRFIWREVEYKGLHSPLVTLDEFQRVRDVFTGHHKPKYRKHQFAFAGLLRCAHDGCTVTTELQKGRYVYYRCSHGRGKCSLPYMREQDLSDQLGNLLLGIRVPDDIAKQIVESLQAESQSSETRQQEQIAALNQKLATLRTRIDQLYDDKLDGKIDEEFWKRKQGALREQERGLETQLATAEAAIPQENALNVERIFELAKKAHSLYVTRNPMERGQLLKSVLLNCTTDGATLWPVYKKPFDLIFERGKTKDWSGRADLNCRPLAPQASALPG
jgi:site-specific DNA recombinase